MKIHAALLLIFLSASPLVAPAELGARMLRPEDEAKIASERNYADRLYEIGKSEEAKAIYLKIAPYFTNDFMFNKRLAHCFFVSPKKEMADAAHYYALAYALNPQDREVEINLGRAYSWSTQYEAAISVFRRVVARDPANGEAWLQIARAQNYDGQVQAAEKTYQSYLERWPGDREVRIEFAAFLSWNKQPEAALQHYRHVLKVDPYNVKARLGQAQVLFWQGKLQESLDAYNELLRGRPNDYAALRGKAFVLLAFQRYEEAGRVFAQVVEQKPADPEIQEAQRQIARWKADEPKRRAQAELDALRRQADAAIAENDLPRAIELLQQVSTRAPQDYGLRFRLGQAYLWNRQWAEAIDTFQKIYAEQPDHLDSLRELGNAQIGANQLNDAAATFRTYLQRSPDLEVFLNLARVLSWSGQFEESISAYEQVLQRDPENFDASLGLAQVLAWQGQLEQALERFDALLRLRPGHRDTLLAKAQVLNWSGRSEEALLQLENMQETWPQDREIANVLQSVRDAQHQRAMQQAAAARPADVDTLIQRYHETLAQRPDDFLALRTLGDLHMQKGDYPQAVSFYEKALAQHPADNTLRLSLAKVASWNHDFPRAIELYQELLGQDPTNREYRMELAKILSWSGRNPEAIEQYRQILQSNPADGEARLGLARVLSWARMLDESLEEYARLLEADPGNRQAAIERARVYSWKGDLEVAADLYDSVLIRDPKDRDARFGKAQTLYWSGRPRKAKEILEELQTENPNDPDVAVTMAGVHAALDRRDLALQELDQLDKMEPGRPDTEQMRHSIQQDLRPVLILGFTPSEDSFDLRIYYATATLFFRPVPQIRSYVFTAIIPSDDPATGRETGRELLFGSSGRVTDWLTLRGEVGVNSATSEREGIIGGGGATFIPTDRMQFDFDVSRRFINYIPQPVRLNISRVQLRAGWDWRPDRDTSIHIDYYHQRYSDTNRNNGGNFSVLRKLLRQERFNLEAGYLYSVYGFSKDLNSGFFAPSEFQRHAALINLRSQLTSRLGFSFWGSLGEESVSTDPYRFDATARGAWDYLFSDHFKLTVGYGYFAISTIVRAGGYTTHTGYLVLEFRF